MTASVRPAEDEPLGEPDAVPLCTGAVPTVPYAERRTPYALSRTPIGAGPIRPR